MWNAITNFFSGGGGAQQSNYAPVIEKSGSIRPRINSIDRDVIPVQRDVSGRIQELIATDGFLSAAVNTHVDHTVGTGLRLNFTPDTAAMGMSDDEAKEFIAAVEAEWKTFTESNANYPDIAGIKSWAQLQAAAYRSFLIRGEVVAVLKADKGRKWQFGIMLVDPARLCTPPTQRLDQDIRGGIRVDKNGKPVEYFFADRNPLDARGKEIKYTGVTPRAKHGMRRVIHCFDHILPEQTRGLSPIAAALPAAKLQNELSDATLRAAIAQTMIASVVKSDLDYEKIAEVIGGEAGTPSATYADMVAAHMAAQDATYGQQGLRIAPGAPKSILLNPNEDVELKTPGVVQGDYEPFSKTLNREAARGSLLTNESYTGSYDGVNFSAGMLSTDNLERGHNGRRQRVMASFCNAVFEIFAEELFIKRPELLPASVDFWSFKDAICRAEWLGGRKSHPDPMKQANAAEGRLQAGITSLRYECSELGLDHETVMRERAAEKKLAEDLGLDDPFRRINRSETTIEEDQEQ